MKYGVAFLAVVGLLMMEAIPAAAVLFKPIVALHGNGTYREFDDFINQLSFWAMGHKVFPLHINLTLFEDGRSLQSIVDEAAGLLDDVIAQNSDLFKDGFIFFAHSQGALIGRAMIQQHDYKVTKFISLAGIMGGFYGNCTKWGESCSDVTTYMYGEGLNKTTVSAYWRAPSRSDYLKGNTFLTRLNNEEGIDIPSDFAKLQKQRFLSVGKYYFFGSSDDDVLEPWFSSLFSTLDADGTTTVSIYDQYIYQYDTFGIQQAMRENRVEFKNIPGVKHYDWLHNRWDIFTSIIFSLFD